MKAAQIVAPRRIEIIDIEEPQLVGAGAVKVRLERACLCGSDMPMFAYDLASPAHGRRATPFLEYERANPYPLRPGQAIHECMGTVAESTSNRFRKGEQVLVLPEAQDGLKEYLCVPEDRIIHLPSSGISKEEILMTQPLGTVVWACQKLGNLLNQDTVVVGQGPMGLMITHMLANLGARTVIALDPLESRLEIAKTMHATHTVNVDKQDPVEIVSTITGGKMADLVVEAVGHQTPSISSCINLVRRLGTLLAFGVPDEQIYEDFAYSAFFRKNLTLIGSVGPDIIPNFSLARDLIEQGRINVAPLITHVLPFQEIQHAYELFVDRKDGAIKVVLNYESL
ncbi:MAG: zinc-binding dehydrogenase [bacterium]|nr:zinc-binding dehydrogenase [bacterium]